MANNNYVSTDKFGNPYTVVGCKPNKNNEDFCAGYIELKGQLYKLEPSEANKDGVKMWVRVTKVSKKQKQSM